LVDDFIEKWKRKKLPDIEMISSNIEIDTPPDPICNDPKPKFSLGITNYH
jgi:hypothetical protein